MNRREFLLGTGTGLAAFCTGRNGLAQEAIRPNILWITCEDMGPHLGCFGDTTARTPALDALAAQGTRYTHAFATSPVCAPARSCIITGIFPTTLGSMHMRSTATLPEDVHGFSQYLREAGYFCTNNAKTDYNFPVPKQAWDECSDRAHWRNRPAGSPFFSVFNLTVTHESQIRADARTLEKRRADLPPERRHDPAQVFVPPYHPDTPAVRRDWANYADNVSTMDMQAEAILKELDEDNLAEDTIVFFFSDHGAGMPRCKRWPYDSGLHVPLIVRFPEQFQALRPTAPGGTCDRLVCFADLGPTVLRLAGVTLPAMQGRAFLGAGGEPESEYLFAVRDRMDEKYDMVRAVRGKRFRYVRQFMPFIPCAQPLSYMDEMPTMQEWRRLAAEGNLSGPAAAFMTPEKPFEELYDIEADPYESANLAWDPAHRDTLLAMRAALEHWIVETRDLGFLPEAEMHARAAAGPEAAIGRAAGAYGLERILETAQLPLRGAAAVSELKNRLDDPDNAVRYWAVLGLIALHAEAKAAETLRARLEDACPSVRIAAAEALWRAQRDVTALDVIIAQTKDASEWVRLHAANVLDRLADAPPAAREALGRLKDDPSSYVVRVVTGEPKPR